MSRAVDLLSARSVLAGNPPPAEWPLRWLRVDDETLYLLWFAYRPGDDSYTAKVSLCAVVPELFTCSLVVIDGEQPDAQTLIEAAGDVDAVRPRYRVDELPVAARRVA